LQWCFAITRLALFDCLAGNCGLGPNMAILPEGLLLRHVATPADLADALSCQLQLDISPAVVQATHLRLAGNMCAIDGDLQGAVDKYQEVATTCTACLRLFTLGCCAMHKACTAVSSRNMSWGVLLSVAASSSSALPCYCSQQDCWRILTTT